MNYLSLLLTKPKQYSNSFMVKRYLDRFTVTKKTVLRNIANHSPNDKASHPTRF